MDRELRVGPCRIYGVFHGLSLGSFRRANISERSAAAQLQPGMVASIDSLLDYVVLLVRASSGPASARATCKDEKTTRACGLPTKPRSPSKRNHNWRKRSLR